AAGTPDAVAGTIILNGDGNPTRSNRTCSCGQYSKHRAQARQFARLVSQSVRFRRMDNEISLSPITAPTSIPRRSPHDENDWRIAEHSSKSSVGVCRSEEHT